MEKVIMVVEDDSDVLEIIEDILEENSYRTVSATNGREAIEELNKEIPDLIISDIIMPYMNGYQLLDYVQTIPKYSHIPFVFLSAKATNQEVRAGMIKGADDYLTKPFRAQELLNMVETRLRKRMNIKKQLDEIKESFALSVPHELRTPLTPILGFSSIMMEEIQSLTKDEIKEMSGAIMANALKLHTSVEKFILFASIHYELNGLSNKIKITANKVEDISDLILVIDNDKNAKYKNNNILNLQIEESPLGIDESYFSICVKEILENAYKFSTPNSTINIIGKKTEDYYQLNFENIGLPFPKDLLNNEGVFNRQTNPKFSGSGLGLHISHKIMEYFGGELRIYSINEGTTLISLKIKIAE